MPCRAHIWVSFALSAALVAVFYPLPVAGQNQAVQPAVQEILARDRVFPEFGPGVIAMKRDPPGRDYILATPANTIAIYRPDGKRAGQVPNANSATAKIVYAEDMDVAADGRIYVADSGANAVKVFNASGSLALTIPVVSPASVVALPDGECAVVSRRSDHLVDIFDSQGALVRSFGDIAELGNRSDPKQLLHRGRLAGDQAGHIYFAFSYLPVPTIRKYDRYGYAAYEISLPFAGLASAGPDEQHEFITLEKRAEAPPIRPVNAIAVDTANQEVWAAIGGDLVHFDKEGNTVADYRTAAADGARIEPTAILVEPSRILVADDRLGIFSFARPDKIPSSTSGR